MFFQDGPTLKNQFQDDPLLSEYLQCTLPKDVYKKIEKHLNEIGEKAAGELLIWADEAERNPPRLIQYDPWGRRIDEIQLCQAWKNFEAFSCINGVVAAAYEREYEEFSRIYQMTLLYLFHPSSAISTCPLAMSDGAARAIEVYGDSDLKNKAFKHLVSRDPKTFWTSGQWMTEKIGGSDVGHSETIAKKTKDGYALYGTKWFTSATNSQMSMTLARIEGAPEGGRGLSLFYLETRNRDGSLNNIEIHRLKDKMGTKALPTAELTLHGTHAHLVGEEGNGVKKISTLFNITRIYNAICSVAQMRRGLALAWDFAHKRKAFGKKLIDHPLHRATLEHLELECRGCFHLVYKAVELLGKEECNKASEQEKILLRVLTSLAKLYTGKSCVWVTSEVLESFGGAGYIEDTGIPKLLRDGQVLSIWEGTTNVLSLDMLRAFEKENGFTVINEDILQRIKKFKNKTEAQSVLNAWQKATLEFQEVLQKGSDAVQEQARRFAILFSRIYIAALMLEHAEKTESKKNLEHAKQWLAQTS